MNSNRNVSYHHAHEYSDRGSKSKLQHENHYTKNQQYVVVVVKEDIGPCCTDDWAYYPQNYTHQRGRCCKFNTACSPCKGNNY